MHRNMRRTDTMEGKLRLVALRQFGNTYQIEIAQAMTTLDTVRYKIWIEEAMLASAISLSARKNPSDERRMEEIICNYVLFRNKDQAICSYIDEVMKIIRRRNREKQSQVALVLNMRSGTYGGGEMWIKETSENLADLGLLVVRVFFKDAEFRELERNDIMLAPGGYEIHIGRAESDDGILRVVTQLITKLKPSLVHCQGEINSIISGSIEESWPYCIVGYHYWTGLIELGQSRNSRILERCTSHRISKSFKRAMRIGRFKPYFVSTFMAEVVARCGLEVGGWIISPCSIDSKRLEVTASPSYREHTNSKKVVQVNCSVGKGGVDFIKLAERLRDLEFVGFVATSIELEELKRTCQKESLSFQAEDNYISTANCTITHKWIEPSRYLRNALCCTVLSRVDETFCRVVVEALADQCPVVAYGNGNLPNLLPTQYLAKDGDVDRLVDIIRVIRDRTRREKTLIDQIGFVGELQHNGRDLFTKKVASLLSSESRCRSVGIFAPLADQGLGYQAACYARSLKKVGVHAVVFSYQPYSSNAMALKYQASAEDWKDIHAYYSHNTREEVTPHEIMSFCRSNGIDTLIYIEPCFAEHFQLISTLLMHGLAVYICPNSEILRSSNLKYLSEVTGIICPTHQCYEICYGVVGGKASYIGNIPDVGINKMEIEQYASRRLVRLGTQDRVKLLLIAGYNHRRKNLSVVIEAFVESCKKNKKIELTVLSQKEIKKADMEKIQSCEKIRVDCRNLGRQEIMQQILAHDVLLHLSTDEGIGLQLYEAVALGTPVIASNFPPQNEPIVSGYNGWLVGGRPSISSENSDSLVNSFVVDKDELDTCLKEMTIDDCIQRSKNCLMYAEKHFYGTVFSNRLASAIRI